MKEETKEKPKETNESHPSPVDFDEVLKNIKRPRTACRCSPRFLCHGTEKDL